MVSRRPYEARSVEIVAVADRASSGRDVDSTPSTSSGFTFTAAVTGCWPWSANHVTDSLTRSSVNVYSPGAAGTTTRATKRARRPGRTSTSSGARPSSTVTPFLDQRQPSRTLPRSPGADTSHTAAPVFLALNGTSRVSPTDASDAIGVD